MTEPRFERAFREWVAREGYGWEPIRYDRPEAGGETVAYRLTPARPPRGVVLAVHGAGNDSFFALVGLFKSLLRRRYEVFTFDLDGHGRSGTTLFSPSTIGGAVHAAAARSGARERGLPLHAIGVSLGGGILLGALPTLDPRPASVTLAVTPLRVALSGRAFAGELGFPLLRTLWREREHYGLDGLVPSVGPFKRGAYPLRLDVPSGPGAFGYVPVLNAALDSLHLEDAARRVESPVLLVYGRRDRLVPTEQGEQLARLLPRSEMLSLPGESHLSAPLAPAAVERMLEWIEEH